MTKNEEARQLSFSLLPEVLGGKILYERCIRAADWAFEHGFNPHKHGEYRAMRDDAVNLLAKVNETLAQVYRLYPGAAHIAPEYPPELLDAEIVQRILN